MTSMFKPTKTLVVGILIGVFVWPVIKTKLPTSV